jgi:hypothetical protein
MCEFKTILTFNIFIPPVISIQACKVYSFSMNSNYRKKDCAKIKIIGGPTSDGRIYGFKKVSVQV